MISQFDINCNIIYDELLSALRNIFMNETSMLDDDESYFARCLEENPARRIAWYFSKVESRIYNVSSMCTCERDVTGLR